MPEVISSGLLMYSLNNGKVKIFLVHPGGPFFTKKDDGYWGIPKGLVEKDEDLMIAAKREFEEETGIKPDGEFIPLGKIMQKGGKRVYAWAFNCAINEPIGIICNTFSMEWPPKSGKYQNFPEVDRGAFFTVEEAEKKINSAQKEFIDRLLEYLKK
ncbi:MAG: NUDIX domain-containing protein [Ignavibacteriaceae bacterium]